MFQRKTLFLFAAAAVFVGGLSHAQSADPAFMLSLSQLPSVTHYELDKQGHLVLLEGQLTGPVDLPPDRVVRDFIGIHPHLYPRADGTAFEVESVMGGDEGVTVVVRQVVDGFEVAELRLVGTVDGEGVLRRVEGVVVPEGGADQRRGPVMGRGEAMEAARAALFGRAGVPALAGEEVAAEATPLLDPVNRRRTWRVELVYATVRTATRYTAVLDAVTGGLVTRREEDVSALVHRRPRPVHQGGGVLPVPGGQRASGVVSVGRCPALDPPPGDFSRSSGVQAWSASGLQRWSYSLFDHVANFETALRLPRGVSGAGSITRTAFDVPSEADRVSIRFPQLSRQLSCVFRWGPTEAQSVSFDAPALVISDESLTRVHITLYLDGNSSWHEGMEMGGTVSRDLTLQFMTAGASGSLAGIDLLPGPRVRLASAPCLYLGDEVAQTYGAGAVMRLHQEVVNLGCDMVSSNPQLGGGTEVPRPVYTYTLYKLDEQGNRLPESQFPPISLDSQCGGELQVTLGAGASVDLDLCSVTLPGPEERNLGPWELEGVLTDAAGRVSTETLRFELLEEGVPDLRVERGSAVESWDLSGSTAHRVTRVKRGQSFPMDFVIRSDQYPSHDVDVDVWARQSFPNTTEWVRVRGVHFDEVAGYTPVHLEGVQLGEAVLPQGQRWGLVDIEITATTAQEELSSTNNNLFVERWMPVYDGPSLADAVAEGVLVPSWREEFDGSSAPSGVTFASNNAWASSRYGEQLQFEGAMGHERPHLVWAFPRPGGASGTQVGAVMVRFRRRRVGPPSAELGMGWDRLPLSGGGEGEVLPPDAPSLEITPRAVEDDNQWHTLVFKGAAAEGVTALDGAPLLDQAREDMDLSLLGVHLETDGNCLEAWIPNSGRQCVDYPQQFVDFVQVWTTEGAAGAWARLEVEGLRAERLDASTGQWGPLDIQPGDADRDGEVATSEGGSPAEFMLPEPGTVRAVLSVCHEQVSGAGSAVILSGLQGSISTHDLFGGQPPVSIAVTGAADRPDQWLPGECHDLIVVPQWDMAQASYSELMLTLSFTDAQGHQGTSFADYKLGVGCSPVQLELP